MNDSSVAQNPLMCSSLSANVAPSPMREKKLQIIWKCLEEKTGRALESISRVLLYYRARLTKGWAPVGLKSTTRGCLRWNAGKLEWGPGRFQNLRQLDGLRWMNWLYALISLVWQSNLDGRYSRKRMEKYLGPTNAPAEFRHHLRESHTDLI